MAIEFAGGALQSRDGLIQLRFRVLNIRFYIADVARNACNLGGCGIGSLLNSIDCLLLGSLLLGHLVLQTLDSTLSIDFCLANSRLRGAARLCKLTLQGFDPPRCLLDSVGVLDLHLFQRGVQLSNLGLAVSTQMVELNEKKNIGCDQKD